MVATYVNKTQDVTILERALPLMEAELSWWETNRTINITSPYSYETFTMTRYAVDNSAPRPESYFEDYQASNGGDLVTPYTDQQKQICMRSSLAERNLDGTSARVGRQILSLWEGI